MGTPGPPQGGRPRAFFRIIGFTRSVRGAGQMVRYVAFRSRDLADREKGGFDKDRDQAHVGSFVRGLPDTLTRHSKAAKAYHCVFSLSRPEFDQSGLKDWRQVVRDVLHTYELETGRKLVWIAAQHDHPTHPHCHVIIKAVYETENGQRRQLRLTRPDLKQIRAITARHLHYPRSMSRALDRGGAIHLRPNRIIRAVDTGLQAIQAMIRQERQRREQADREHQAWLREHEERER